MFSLSQQQLVITALLLPVVLADIHPILDPQSNKIELYLVLPSLIALFVADFSILLEA